MPRKINLLVFMSMQWYILGTALPILLASQKKKKNKFLMWYFCTSGKISASDFVFKQILFAWGKMRPKQKKCNTFWRDLFDIRWFNNKLTTDLFSIHYVTEIAEMTTIMLLWWCSFSILMLYSFIHAFIFKLVY